MTSDQALARLTKPRQTRRSRRPTTGDEFRGGVCPLDSRHGLMLVMKSGSRYCPHSDHSAGLILPAIAPEA